MALAFLLPHLPPSISLIVHPVVDLVTILSLFLFPNDHGRHPRRAHRFAFALPTSSAHRLIAVYHPGPTYISSRSADVILSDVRPIKLKLEALRAINVLLDEFLYNLLDAAGSISTDKLKSGLIKILPTSLGKEAILEAELELKAYLERSPPSSPILPSGSSPREEADEFDLQWSYEVSTGAPSLPIRTDTQLHHASNTLSYYASNVKHIPP